MAEGGRAPMGDDSSPTVNLIALSSAVRVRPRVGVGLENEYARQRCLLDQTIIEEARSPDIAEGNRDREVVAEEESHSTPPAAPKSSLVSEQSLTKHWNATNIETAPLLMQRDIERLWKICERAMLEKSAIEQQLREWVERSVRNERLLSAKEDELQELHRYHDDEFTILEAERQELKGRCDHLQTIFDRHAAVVNSLTVERDEANAQCEKLFLEMHGLQQQLRKLERLDNSNKSLQERLDELQRAYEELEGQSRDQLPPASANDGVIAKLQSELESALKAKTILEGQLTIKEEELHDLKAAAFEQASDMEAGFAKRDADISDLEQKLEEANDRIRQLMESEAGLKKQLQAETLRADGLDKKLNCLEKICDAADASEDEYKREIGALKHQILKLEADSEKTKSKLRKLEAREAKYKDASKNKEQQGASAASNANSSTHPTSDTAQNSIGSLVAPAGNSIVEMGRSQLLETQVYQLNKQLRQLQKENAELRKEKHPPNQSAQAEGKENQLHPGHMRRAISECDRPDSRPLQDSNTSNASASHLSLPTGALSRSTSQQRFFPMPTMKKEK